MSLSLIDYVSLFFVMVIGLPHGAFDNALGYLLGYGRSLKSFIQFSAAYLGIAGLVYLVWLFVPVISLICFLGYSLVHFGLGDVTGLWRSVPESSKSQLFTSQLGSRLLNWTLVYAHGGLVTIFVPFWHADEVSVLFQLLSGEEAATIMTIISPLSIIWVASLLVIISTAIFEPLYRRSAFELVVLTFCLNFLPPLAGFAFYFCAVHSRRHFQQVWSNITSTLSGRYSLGLAAILTAASWALAGALYASQPIGDSIDAALLRSVFILLAALTVPHMLLVDMLFRPHILGGARSAENDNL